MADLNAAIKLEVKDPDAFVLRGILHKIRHDYARGLADYEKAITLDPKDPRSYDVEAYLLSACPMPEYRDAKKAIAYATKACELGDWRRSDHMETLAAAYAAGSQFDEAIKWQMKAGEIDPKAVDDKRLELYRKNEPFRDLNRKEPPVANLGNIKDKVTIGIGQKLKVRFEVRGDELFEPQIGAAGKVAADSVSLEFREEKRGRTLYISHSFVHTVRSRCLARLKGYDTYFETDIIPIPVSIINREIWHEPIEELVLFDFRLVVPDRNEPVLRALLKPALLDGQMKW